MNLQIPFPDEARQDLRQMITTLAKEVIEEVKLREKEPKEYLTIKETEKYLNVSFVTLQKYQREYGLPSITIEGKRLFKKSTIDRWISQFES